MNYGLAPLTEKESVHGVLIRIDPGARTEMHHRRGCAAAGAVGYLAATLPPSAACCCDVRAEILDGACQRVCAETNGSNNQKTQCCDCPSRISHRQKDKFHGRPGDCESPKGKLPQKLAEDLASLNLQISLGAIWSCSTETVNSAGGPHRRMEEVIRLGGFFITRQML